MKGRGGEEDDRYAGKALIRSRHKYLLHVGML